MREWIKPLAVGFIGAVVAIVIVGAIWFVADLHRMAKNGDAAFRFIDQAQRQAQQQQAPATK